MSKAEKYIATGGVYVESKQVVDHDFMYNNFDTYDRQYDVTEEKRFHALIKKVFGGTIDDGDGSLEDKYIGAFIWSNLVFKPSKGTLFHFLNSVESQSEDRPLLFIEQWVTKAGVKVKFGFDILTPNSKKLKNINYNFTLSGSTINSTNDLFDAYVKMCDTVSGRMRKRLSKYASK